MLLSASSLGGSASLRAACGCHQLRRGADGCPSGTRARQRRSDLARTAAEILVADLNRPARGRHGRGACVWISTGWRTMFSHGWSVRALPLRKAPLGALSIMLIVLALAVLGAAGSAHGDPGQRA